MLKGDVNPVKWGWRLAGVTEVLYIIVMLGFYLNFISLDIEMISRAYPGFSVTPVGLIVGGLWMIVDGFTIGFLSGYLVKFWTLRL